MWNQHGFFLWVYVSVTVSQVPEDFNSERDPGATLQAIHCKYKELIQLHSAVWTWRVN